MNKKTVTGYKVKGNIKRKDFALGAGAPNVVVSDEAEIDASWS